jgi:hypothetical protein
MLKKCLGLAAATLLVFACGKVDAFYLKVPNSTGIAAGLTAGQYVKSDGITVTSVENTADATDFTFTLGTQDAVSGNLCISTDLTRLLKKDFKFGPYTWQKDATSIKTGTFGTAYIITELKDGEK